MSALLSTFWSYNTMHKPLNVAERAKLQLAEPVEVTPPMTRREKLLRLAEIARGGRPSLLTKVLVSLRWQEYYEKRWHIFDLLEHMNPAQLAEQSNAASIFDAAAKDGIPGFHSLRRFRTTRLREVGTPEDILKFWIGHGSKDITDRYSKLASNEALRKEWAEKAGLGFSIGD